MLQDNDRLRLLIRILEPEDYAFIQRQNPLIAGRFRRDRMKVFRGGLRAITQEFLRSYEKRLSRINAAGCWQAYPGLLWSTITTFFFIGELWLAGALFWCRLP